MELLALMFATHRVRDDRFGVNFCREMMSALTTAFFRSCRRVRGTVAIDQPRQQLFREFCFTTRDAGHLGP